MALALAAWGVVGEVVERSGHSKGKVAEEQHNALVADLEHHSGLVEGLVEEEGEALFDGVLPYEAADDAHNQDGRT